MGYVEDEIEIKEGHPEDLPLWYVQFCSMSESQKDSVSKKALAHVRKFKPETYDFIKKFKCKLVGVSPRVEYNMVAKDGTTYIHPYSMPTLLYWCPRGKFHFSVNANLDHDDTVLNRVKGNRKDRKIKGFTG